MESCEDHESFAVYGGIQPIRSGELGLTDGPLWKREKGLKWDGQLSRGESNVRCRQ
jgi:hypothetical protein